MIVSSVAATLYSNCPSGLWQQIVKLVGFYSRRNTLVCRAANSGRSPYLSLDIKLGQRRQRSLHTDAASRFYRPRHCVET